jgi:2'-5' RNA ligase
MSETQFHSDFLIASCLDQVENGVIPKVPRHVTIVPWFRLGSHEAGNLKNELRGVSGRHEKPMITGADVAYFGPDSDVLVRELESDEALNRLHADCLAAVVACNGIIRRQEYIGANYDPHVSKQADGWLQEGETVELQSIQLVEAIESPRGKRNIIAQYELMG